MNRPTVIGAEKIGGNWFARIQIGERVVSVPVAHSGATEQEAVQEAMASIERVAAAKARRGVAQ